MKNKLRFLIFNYLYWLLFFQFQKISFLLYYSRKSVAYIKELPGVFVHGFLLDLSMGAYVMIFPVLACLMGLFFSAKWTFRIIAGYTYLVVVLFSLLLASDLALYKEWGFRLDSTPILYLANPHEALASVSLPYILIHLFIAALLFVLFILIYNKVFRKIQPDRSQQLISAPLLLVTLGLLFFPIRGGLATAPINTGSAYFSDNIFVNHAALNLQWNIAYSFTNLETVENLYIFQTSDEVQNQFLNYSRNTGKFPLLLKNTRPNVILIVLESFTANIVGCLNGTVPVTPELDLLAKNGILFTHFYASGDRTDKGALALLSGYPSQPTTSIIKFPNKTQSLPSLAQVFNEQGYSTHFYYGGDINFANFNSYLHNCQFHNIYSLKNFPESEQISSWGVPDEYLFNKVENDLSQIKSPYFINLFTLSSHMPYDVPEKNLYPGTSEEALFLNSAGYTDKSIGRFINNLEKKGLLTNTLVILVADHGFGLPGNLDYFEPNRFTIPMIWYGGSLAVKSVNIDHIGSQTDLAASLLAQMDLDHSKFTFSRNILADSTQQKAIYAYNNGYGYITDSVQYYYFRESDKVTVVSGTLKENDIKSGKAYIQYLYNDLINR